MARSRLSNVIVANYLSRIGSGELEPGTQLPPEASLCDSYDVSRSVVREALQALDAKGFIHVKQGSLAVVAARHLWHVLDKDFLEANNPADYYFLLQEARELLEPALAALAADRATAPALEDMESINQQLSQAQDDARAHADLDIEFHDALARATDNAILVSFHNSLTGLGQSTRIASATVPGAIDRAVAWHAQIIEALKQGDAKSASAAMHLHLKQVRAELANVDVPKARATDQGDRP